jgi:hypothetical protein
MSVLFVMANIAYENFMPPHPRYPHIAWIANNAYSLMVFGIMDLYAISKMWE